MNDEQLDVSEATDGVCAFCGKGLRGDAPGSLWIAVRSTRDEATQGLFAHAECLAEKLHESIPFEGWVFEPDDEDDASSDVSAL